MGLKRPGLWCGKLQLCRQWHLTSISPHFLASLPCVLFYSQEDLSIMVARWLAAKSRLTPYWHGHSTAVLATVSGAYFTEPVWVLCPSLPGAVVIPVPKPHGLKAMKGGVPIDAEGAGPGEGGRAAKAVSLLLCATVSIKSQSSPNITPPPFLSYSPTPFLVAEVAM